MHQFPNVVFGNADRRQRPGCPGDRDLQPPLGFSDIALHVLRQHMAPRRGVFKAQRLYPVRGGGQLEQRVAHWLPITWHRERPDFNAAIGVFELDRIGGRGHRGERHDE